MEHSVFGWWFGPKHVFLLGTVHILGWIPKVSPKIRPGELRTTGEQLGNNWDN